MSISSTHKCEVVSVKLEKHPNADNLALTRVYGYTVVVNKNDWQDGQLGAFVVPDSLVDTSKPEFSFLGTHNRITVRRFRGVFSQGLLVPAPVGSKEGDDVAELLGVTRYEPDVKVTQGDSTSPPPGFHPKYDIETWYKYKDLLISEESVVVTEKIHGTSGRYCFVDDQMYCGSRNEWKKETKENLYWKCLVHNPQIEMFCKDNPELTLYGEVYGPVQKLKYGRTGNNVGFAAFDIFDSKTAKFLPWGEFNYYILHYKIPQVPSLYIGPYSESLVSLADGQSKVTGADNIREGVVIQPIAERIDSEIGRVKLKMVSNVYLEKDK